MLTYLFERFRSWYADDGVPAEVFMAVLAKNLDNPLDFHLRVQAVYGFSQLAEAINLAAANKRVSNILAKAEETIPPNVDSNLFEKQEEIALFEQLTHMSSLVTPLFSQRRYSEAMQHLATLREPVDNFFDQVMVMAKDDNVRCNRLRLLTELRNLFLNVADISHLVPQK